MSRETRLFLFLVLWLGIVFVFMILFPTPPKTSQSQTTTNQNFLPKQETSSLTFQRKPFSTFISNYNLMLSLSDLGIESIDFYYVNRIYELSRSNYVYIPFSILLSSVISSTNVQDNSIIPFDVDGISKVRISGNDFSLKREITFVSNYVFDITIKVKNNSKKPAIFNGFSIVFSGPLGPDTTDEHYAYMYLRTGYIEKGTYNFIETLTTSIFTGTERFAIKESVNVSGVWMENRYVVVGIVPLNVETRAEFVVKDNRYGHNKVMSLRTPSEIIDVGGEKEYKFRVFAGPRKNEVLESFGYGFRNLEDGGILKPIYDFLKFLLNLFYSLTGSWGLAVILISIAVKILLEPLSIKSAVSMKRLQLIAPKIKEIQEKYKNDPKKMNAEIAELYRIYGANPASGCLPLLLQIPIFIALYNVLSGFIELKGQGLLWIKDLTKPDTVLYIKELEGFFILPASINLLPIIMTGISLLQTYISSSKTQNQQMMTMWLLPIIFMFIFWNLPSALVLYWTIQTLLGVIEQYIVNRTLKY